MSAIDSPCIKVCELDAARGWCRGCYRTLAEISRWVNSSRTERRAVLKRAAQRKAAAAAGEFK